MICARCDKPIKPDEPYRKDVHPGTTAAGGDFYVHAYLCKKPPTQTSQISRR